MINHCAAQVWPQKRFLFRADYFQSSMAFKGRSATALVQPELLCFKKQLKFSIKTAKKQQQQKKTAEQNTVSLKKKNWQKDWSQCIYYDKILWLTMEFWFNFSYFLFCSGGIGKEEFEVTILLVSLLHSTSLFLYFNPMYSELHCPQHLKYSDGLMRNFCSNYSAKFCQFIYFIWGLFLQSTQYLGE